MNSVFDTKRTWWLLRKLVVEVRIDFLQLLALLFVIDMIFLNGVLSFADNVVRVYDKVRLIAFVMGLSIAGSLYLYRTTKKLQEKERQIDDFKLPNSILEKCVINVAHSFVLLTTILAVFWFSDWLTINVSTSFILTDGADHFSLNNPMGFIYIGALIFFFICCILGYIQHTIENKTKGTVFSFMWFGFFFCVNVILNFIFLKGTIPTTYMSLPFMKLKLKNPNFEYNYYVITSGITNNQVILYFLLPIAVLTILIYFFRLKEKEM